MPIRELRQDSSALDKAAFCRYVRAVFPSAGFERWIEWQQWTEDYRTLSWFEGDDIVANVSLQTMHLVLDGGRKRAWQFGAVGVRPEARRQGLAQILMTSALEIVGDDPALLFANPDVLGFYPRYGFEPREESLFFADVDIQPSTLAPAIDPTDARLREQLNALATTPISERFACVQHGPIVQWYLANGFVSAPRQLDDETFVFSQQADDTLYLLDVISRHPVDLTEYLPRLIERPVRRLRFGFCPDRLWPCAKATGVDPDPYLFVRGMSPIAPHKFPVLAQT